MSGSTRCTGARHHIVPRPGSGKAGPLPGPGKQRRAVTDAANGTLGRVFTGGGGDAMRHQICRSSRHHPARHAVARRRRFARQHFGHAGRSGPDGGRQFVTTQLQAARREPAHHLAQQRDDQVPGRRRGGVDHVHRMAPDADPGPVLAGVAQAGQHGVQGQRHARAMRPRAGWRCPAPAPPPPPVRRQTLWRSCRQPGYRRQRQRGSAAPRPARRTFATGPGRRRFPAGTPRHRWKCRWNRRILRSAIRSNSRNGVSACTKCRAQSRCWPRQPKRGVVMAQHHLHAAERRNVGQGHLAIARDRAHQHPAGPPPGSGSSAKNTRLRPSAAHRCRWCNATRARQGWYRRSAASGSNWIRQGCQAATRPRNHRCRIGTGRG